jgi:ubiquitin carboxyl-terminal hydrolase 14
MTTTLIKIKLKWNGQSFDLDMDPSQSLDVLKIQVFSLTSVDPSRQKILKSGVQVKETTDLSKFKQGYAFYSNLFLILLAKF